MNLCRVILQIVCCIQDLFGGKLIMLFSSFKAEYFFYSFGLWIEHKIIILPEI